MVQDLATPWVHFDPCKTKTSQETEKSSRKFLQPSESRKSFTLTIHWNLAKSCEDLSWNHRSSTPDRSETNGIAETAVRRMKEGTSTALLQSGLDEKWWAHSMECYCYLRNVQRPTPCSQTLKNWKTWTRQRSTLEESMQKKYQRHKRENISYSQKQMVQQTCQRETTNTENWKGFNRQKQKMTLKPGKTSG